MNKNEVNDARRDLHTQLLAQLAAGEKRRSWLLMAMTAPAVAVLGLIAYRLVASLP